MSRIEESARTLLDVDGHKERRAYLIYVCVRGMYQVLILLFNAGTRTAAAVAINPFRTAVPFWGQNTLIPSSLSPKRDCGPNTFNRGYLA